MVKGVESTGCVDDKEIELISNTYNTDNKAESEVRRNAAIILALDSTYHENTKSR